MLFVLRCFEAKSLDKTSFSGVGFQGKVVDLVLSNNFPWEPMSEDEVLSRVLVDLCRCGWVGVVLEMKLDLSWVGTHDGQKRQKLGIF